MQQMASAIKKNTFLDAQLEPVIEESFDKTSLENFVMETQKISQAQTSKKHQPLDNSVDLREFPNADFYYKLVAKVNGKYFSIFDSNTEYVIGAHMEQQVKPDRGGGYYVYGSVQEAVFADVPFNKGGHYIAPRTILKVIAWGDQIKYTHGKIAFNHLLPVQDIGLPIGYKNSKESIKLALRHQEERKLKSKEYQYNNGLVRKKAKVGYEADKFENYFGTNSKPESSQSLRPQSSKSNYQKREVDVRITNEIQNGLNKMIEDLENQYR
ncbi:UNKNOWN [Stylonychia lemnae]|uniref:Uncharacterized protein n=1 Tax=Stylonychia lemnae TaxID=5949 RepID=A0A078ASX1_STYLE|nr:UNKNOWN [Stylonychia lemnae]|eukprot:CDW85565.1 UNKNOWN [Stylonychia lemnae]